MADVEDRQAQSPVAQAFEIGQDLLLARAIEARQWFVHQQQARMAKQGATKGNTLLFSARQGRRGTVEQGFKPQKRHDILKARPLAVTRGIARAEGQVLAHIKMRKKPRILKDIAQPAAMWRHPDAALRIQEHLTLQHHAADIRAQQSGKRVDHRRLARTRAAKKRGDAPFGGE